MFTGSAGPAIVVGIVMSRNRSVTGLASLRKAEGMGDPVATCDHCDGTGEVIEPSRTPEEQSHMIPCGNCQPVFACAVDESAGLAEEAADRG